VNDKTLLQFGAEACTPHRPSRSNRSTSRGRRSKGAQEGFVVVVVVVV